MKDDTAHPKHSPLLPQAHPLTPFLPTCHLATNYRSPYPPTPLAAPPCRPGGYSTCHIALNGIPRTINHTNSTPTSPILPPSAPPPTHIYRQLPSLLSLHHLQVHMLAFLQQQQPAQNNNTMKKMTQLIPITHQYSHKLTH